MYLSLFLNVEILLVMFGNYFANIWIWSVSRFKIIELKNEFNVYVT